jgi:hypothetical protein
MLALARRPMRVLTPIIERAALAMLYAGQYLTLRCPLALELIGDHHPRHVLTPFEQRAEKLRFPRI